MDSRKLMLMFVAVLAVGIFALPSTVAMFGGQHNWYNLEPDGNDVPCEKCHADVYDELYNSVGPHDEMECWYCHRTSSLLGYTYASGDGTGSVPGEEAHAASTVECMACHGGQFISGHPAEWGNETCANCHVAISDLNAGGFGLTPVAADTGANAAHMDFVNGSIDDDLMEGANEACITCHTHTAIDINWTHAYKMSLDARQTTSGVWEISNFRTEGSYNVTTYGNMSGATTGVSNATVDVTGLVIPGYDSENP